MLSTVVKISLLVFPKQCWSLLLTLPRFPVVQVWAVLPALRVKDLLAYLLLQILLFLPFSAISHTHIHLSCVHLRLDGDETKSCVRSTENQLSIHEMRNTELILSSSEK